ncbi:uncharacterized protein KIAA0754-like [Oreochromis niloticus]|uniref:uncharacterized protein KIAA0754-like n=1 Tax=Oreochromis niloticus TaxID=8128 RepID=UPI000DF3DC83|nr:uncharacterized protein KIAA0754-like [Oreochromis niloticus]
MIHMGPADSEERLRREVMDKIYKLCDLWWEKPGEVLHRAVERRLKETLLKFPWLVDSLNPVVMDFLLSTLHLHSPTQAAHRPGQPVDSRPDTPAPLSTLKRRRRRSVVPDILTAGCAAVPPSSALPAATTPPSSPPRAATAPPGPAQPEPEELSRPEGLVLPKQELSEPEEPVLSTEEVCEPEDPVLPTEEVSESEEPALPTDELSEPESPAQPLHPRPARPPRPDPAQPPCPCPARPAIYAIQHVIDCVPCYIVATPPPLDPWQPAGTVSPLLPDPWPPAGAAALPPLDSR